MGTVAFSISMSLDGYVAGPDDNPEQGLGRGGEVLHQWVLEPSAVDREVLDAAFAEAGAIVVGRRTFDLSGAWGGDPPGGLPCVVLTHEPPAQWSGPESAFMFVTDGIESAVARAREVAGEKVVAIGGGADIARQAIEAGLVDEIHIQLVPVLLGAGVRLFEHLGTAPVGLETIRVVQSPNVTHLGYRVIRPAATRE